MIGNVFNLHVVCIGRDILEINCGGDESATQDDTSQQTGFGATAEFHATVPMNRCGAKLSSDSREENDEELKEDVSDSRHQNGFQDAADTDRLAACRMTLLEDVTLSGDSSTTCPSLSTIHSVHRSPTAARSPLVVEVEGSTPTSFPDTTPTDVTTTKSDKISSNDDGFSVTVGSSEWHPDGTVGEVKDASWRRSVYGTNVPWSTDGSLEMQIKSPTTCSSVGWPQRPTSESLMSYDSCSGRMKGLRIPSAGRGSLVTTTTSSEDGRRRLDLPLIAGITPRRIDDSPSSSVLPATLLPRPFMPRTCYRSVRPSFSTSSTLTGTENKVDGCDCIAGAGSRLAPPAGSVENSTTVTDVEKVATASCPTSSARSQPSGNQVRPFYSASSAVMKPDDEVDDWSSTFRVAKTMRVPTNGVEESTTDSDTEMEKPTYPATTILCQQLGSEIADVKGFQVTHDSPDLDTSDELSSTIVSRTGTPLFAGNSLPNCRQKPNGNSEEREVKVSRSSEYVFVSPNLDTPGQSLNDCQQPFCKLSPPPTMPKPTLPRPVPPAARVADPLLPPSFNPHHSVTQDDVPVISSADSADRGRTTPDGGSDSDTHEHETSTLPSSHTSTPSSAGHNAATATKAALAVDSYSSYDDQSTALRKDEVTAHRKTTDKEVADESDGSEELAAETAGTSVSKFDTSNNRGWRNGVNRSTAKYAGTLSMSNKLSLEERRKLRGRRQPNGSCDETAGLARRTSVECAEEASKAVDGSSDQRDAEIISLEKGVFGLGFCIEGGRDCPTGRAPVTVKRIFRGELISTFRGGCLA